MASATSNRLPGKIKVLYETKDAGPGAYDRAVAHGKGLAFRRQTDTFVDFRPSKRTWVVWSWAHHASPHVISLAEVTDPHGRFGLTHVGPPAAVVTRPAGRRARHGDITITDVTGRQREAPHVWPDGSYTCPFCSSPVRPTDKSCQNPACAAGENASPERVRAGIEREEKRKSEEARHQEIREFQKKYAEESRNERLARQAELTAEAVRRGACTRCLGKTSIFQTGHGTPKFVRHRSGCPLAR